jgi:haloalkane dehalogenase
MSEGGGFKPSAELFPFESRWLTTSAGRVHYIDEGRGQPILFLHGNPTWSFLYRNIVRLLSDRFRCVAHDHLGFGLSERPAGFGYTPAEHAAVARELVDHLGLEELVVMGQDWGGPIGISVACSVADRIQGLVLGNTWFWQVDRLATRMFSRVMSSRVMQRRILERNYFVERLIPMGTARKLTDLEMAHYRGVQPSPAARVGVAEFPRQILSAGPWLADLERNVKETLASKAVLLVWGMRDFAFPPRSHLPRLRRIFRDVELVELPRAKHFIQEDAPADVADAILKRFE